MSGYYYNKNNPFALIIDNIFDKGNGMLVFSLSLSLILSLSLSALQCKYIDFLCLDCQNEQKYFFFRNDIKVF